MPLRPAPPDDRRPPSRSDDSPDGPTSVAASSSRSTSAVETPISQARPTGKRGGAIVSFRAAFAGVGRTIASQRNMKMHILSGLMVLIVGMALPLDLASRVVLLFAIAVVFFAEILNTGLEAIVDLFIGEYHRLAMLAKDAAAGGVLVFSIATVLVFCEILYTRWDLVTNNLDAVWTSVAFGVPLVISEAIGLFVIRRGLFSWVRLVTSLALVSPLVANTKDPIYAGLAVFLVLLSYVARATFPRHPGRGAPPRTDGGASAVVDASVAGAGKP